MELLRYFSNSCSIRYQVIVQNVNVAITSIYVQRQAGEQTEDPFTVPAPGRNWSFLAIGIWVASLPVIPCLVMCWFWAGKDRYVVLLRTFSSSTSYTCLWGMGKSLVPATYTRVSWGWEQCRNIHSQCEVEKNHRLPVSPLTHSDALQALWFSHSCRSYLGPSFL